MFFHPGTYQRLVNRKLVFIPPKSAQANFVLGKNYVRTVFNSFIPPPKKSFYTPKTNFWLRPCFHRYCVYTGPLESLYMTSDADDQMMTSSLLLPPVTSLTVHDGDSVSLRCVSRGGCPAPRLRVRIGYTEVTSSFRRTNHDVEVSGRRGLRRMMCGATLRTSKLVARRQYDELPVRCEAESKVVGAVVANYTQLVLLVQC